jgi:ADP-heptose:LPS heptosyltransferase
MKKRAGSIRAVKRVVDRIFFLVMWMSLKRRPAAPEKAFLLVRTDGIGDFVFFGRYLSSVKKSYPDYTVALVCQEETADLAKCLPLIDTVIPFKDLRYRHNYFYRLFVLRKIRFLAPAYAAYLSFHRKHTGDEMTILSGAEETFGFSGNDECIHPSMRRKNNSYYKHIVEAPDHIPEKERYVRFFEAISGEEPIESRVSFSVEKRDNDAVENYLRSQFTGNTSQFIVLGPCGSAAIREWHEERFAAVADALIEKIGSSVVLCGKKSEHWRLQSIAGRMKYQVVIASSFSLPQVVALLQKAALFVGNESGLLHLAATVGIPAVGILGGGHFSRYFPYGNMRIVTNKLPCFECNWSCIFEKPLCITEITVEDVLANAEQLLVSAKSLVGVVGQEHGE